MIKLERSQKILALILALVMIGSILTYAFRGTIKIEEREIKFEMGKNLSDWLRYLPSQEQMVLFYNYQTKNKTLLHFIYNSTLNNIDPYILRVLKPDLHYYKKLLIGQTVYFIDVGKVKVYFTAQSKSKYMNYTVKVSKVFGRTLALVDEVDPVIIGNPEAVIHVIDLIRGNGTSLIDKYKYLMRINGSFDYAIIVSGNLAKRLIRSNNTSIADFYFEGYRMNGTLFEKIVGIHFIGNYFFVKSNKTKYYFYKNYDDGFSLAIMGDYNLTKLIKTMPEIRSIQIKVEK
ncbi:MAG TPA: hypothetical protein EYH00_02315 [Archaeoglobus profundus]|nr:hypothetical protein [Archaeoglobus profundus]